MRPSVRAAAAVILLASAWASAGAAPFEAAVTGAPAPIDFVRDYVAAAARVHLGRGAAPADEAGNAYAALLGAQRVVLLEGPFHLHPPPALLPVLPLVPLGFGRAALAWLAISIVALGALAFVLVELFAPGAPPPRAHVAVTFVLLLLWPPVLHNLAKGQWSILLALFIAAGCRALDQRRPRAAGVWLGVAASLKATPLLLLGFLALRHRRAAAWMLAALAVAGLASLAVGGLEPWRAWLADAPRDVAAWQTWNANTISLNGFVARLFAGGQFARPLVAWPALARALNVALSLGLAAAAALATRHADGSSQTDRRLLAGWIALAVLINPLGWTHTAVIALVPAALLGGEAPVLVTAALILLSLPRETLAALAGPLPTPAGRGMLLSLHALAVAMLVVASFGPRAARAKGSSAPSA